jgi:hypothetical protein
MSIDRDFEEEEEFYTKVVGVTKENDCNEDIQELLCGLSATSPDLLDLSFEHEEDNPYDKNAIKVFCDNDHIGYLSRDIAKRIAYLVDDGRVAGEVNAITGGNGKKYGCNILIKILDEYEWAKHISMPIPKKDSPTPIRTAEEMLDYCTKYNMGSGRFKAWDLKHLKLIEDAVEPDEAILTVFIGVHDYHSFWGINNSYAYAITSKRFLMAQKKAIGSVLDSMPLESVHFSCSSETHIGVITVVLLGRTFKIAVSKDSLTNIDYCIKSALSMAKDIAAN